MPAPRPLSKLDHPIYLRNTSELPLPPAPLAMARPTPPINRLPPEVLSYIFVLCLPRSTSHSSYDHIPNPTRAPLLLCHVCRDWRQLAELTPFLWKGLSLSAIPRPFSVTRAAKAALPPDEPTPGLQPHAQVKGNPDLTRRTANALRTTHYTTTWVSNAHPLPLETIELAVSRFSAGVKTDWEMQLDLASTYNYNDNDNSARDRQGFCSGVLASVLLGPRTANPEGRRGKGIKKLDLTVDYIWDLPFVDIPVVQDEDTLDALTSLRVSPMETLTLRTVHQTAYFDGPVVCSNSSSQRNGSHSGGTTVSVSPFSAPVAPNLQNATLDVPWTGLISVCNCSFGPEGCPCVRGETNGEGPYSDNPTWSYHANPHQHLSSLLPWQQFVYLELAQPIPVHVWKLIISQCMNLEVGKFALLRPEDAHGGMHTGLQGGPLSAGSGGGANGAVLARNLRELWLILDEKKPGLHLNQWDEAGVEGSLFYQTFSGLKFSALEELRISAGSKRGIEIPFFSYPLSQSPTSAMNSTSSLDPVPSSIFDTFQSLSSTLTRLSLDRVHCGSATSRSGVIQLLRYTSSVTYLAVKSDLEQDAGELSLWDALIDDGRDWYTDDVTGTGAGTGNLLPKLEELAVQLSPSTQSDDLHSFCSMVLSRWKARPHQNQLYSSQDMAMDLDSPSYYDYEYEYRLRRHQRYPLRRVTVHLESTFGDETGYPHYSNGFGFGYGAGQATYSWSSTALSILQGRLGRCAVDGLELQVTI